MLEFLGFIALIAIIFGVSFTTALTGFFKFVLIAIAVCAVIAIAVKLCEKFWGAVAVLAAGLIAIYLGCIMMEDKAYTNYLKMCNDYNLDLNCVLSASDQHNETVNKAWGYLIGGTAATIAGGCCAIANRKDLNKPKKRSAA